MTRKFNPFEHNYFLGYVSQVFPQFIKVHFPSSVLLNGFTHFGEEYNGGLVGNFVVIEGDQFGFLGRITELSLPESERLSLNEKAFQTNDFHPTGKIEILLSFDLFEPLKVRKGLTAHPNIGAKVYVSSSILVQEYMSRFGIKTEAEKVSTYNLGTLVANPQIEVSVNLQSVFGRHCAIVGTTGSGKSYTVSKLIESLSSLGGIGLLIDATGEYNDLQYDTENINIGDGTNVFHYSQLTVDDLFFLFRPSVRTQAPKLLEAIRSLKMVELNNGNAFNESGQTVNVVDGIVKKTNSPKRPFDAFYYRNINRIEDNTASFDIKKLIPQIIEECVYDNGVNWGGKSDSDASFCVSLISRINNVINTPEYNKIFGFHKSKDTNDLTDAINSFIEGSEKQTLRLNFENVKFEYQVREILANSIGRFLLNKARNKDFVSNPLVVFIDEAHQFLNKSVNDEYFDTKSLDAFDSIAKESRKQGLFLSISTQMPRDIPHGTLSQMGTFIVHRLINYNDKEAIVNACNSANRNTLDFLPILGEGEAILTGVDFPMPIIMKFHEPSCKPDSKTPNIFTRTKTDKKK